MRKEQRIYSIDLLRILSVFAIFLFHSFCHLKTDYKILDGVIEEGAIFMILFFMISGFVTFYTHFNRNFKNKEDIYVFLKKRIINIYPAYLFICLIYLIFDKNISWIKKILLFPMDAMMLQSSVDGTFGVLHHGGTWFISCIFICYIITPFIVPFFTKLNNKECIILWFVLYIIDSYMAINVHIMHFSNIYSNILFRCIEFILGMLLCKLYIDLRNRISDKHCKIKSYLVFILFVIIISIFHGIGGSYRDYVFLAIPLFALLIWNSIFIEYKEKSNKIFESKIFKYTNEIAYEFFLGQFFCWSASKKICDFIGFNNEYLMVIIAFLICYAIAVALHEIITKKIKKLLTREDKK